MSGPAPRPWERAGYLVASGGRLHMDGVDLAALARERGTPLFVYSARRLLDTAHAMRHALQAVHERTTVCFATKACSAVRVLKLLAGAKLACEVNSGGELFKALTAGFAPDAIVFNAVTKTAEEIAAALSPPIKAINVDSVGELARIDAVAAALGVVANVSLRIVPGVESETSAGNRTGSERTKFGILERELPEALDLIGRGHGCLRLVGLHAHIGSQIADARLYAAAAQRLASVARGLDRPLQHVNIGGGFAIAYLRGRSASPQAGLFGASLPPSAMAEAAFPSLRAALGDGIEILVEPGRSLVGDSAVLLSRVEATKTRAGDRWLTLDAGYNTLVESYTYKWYYEAVAAERLDEDTDVGFRLAGPLCDSGDVFHDVEGEALLERLTSLDPVFADRRELLGRELVRLPPLRRLPQATTAGDLLAFLDTGAYALDQMTPNNGRPRAEVGLLDVDGGYRLIRRRDSLADLLHNEVF